MKTLAGVFAGAWTLALLSGCAESPVAESPALPRPLPTAAAVPAPLLSGPLALADRAAAASTSEASARKTGGVRDVTFDTIKFEMKKGDPFKRSMLTKEIEALMGEKIKVRGYIFPTFQQTGIKTFVLVRDNMECCFGPGAALFDCIVVDMVEGRTAEFSTRPVTVEGKFSFQELKDPFTEEIRAIYHLDGESVK